MKEIGCRGKQDPENSGSISKRPYNSDMAMAMAQELGVDVSPLYLRIILEAAYANR